MSGNQNNKNVWKQNNNNNQNSNKNNGNVWKKPTNTISQKVAAPPVDGQPVDAMRNMNLSDRNTTSTAPQVAAQAAARQAAYPQTALSQATPSLTALPQAAPAQVASSQPTSSQANPTQAAPSPTAPPDKLPLELLSDGQPKVNPEDKKGKDPTYHDEKYALSSTMGKTGDPLKIRVNRFQINYGQLPAKFCVYSVALPLINNRPVTKRHIKKLLMQGVLGPHQPWAQAFATNQIFTDWDGLIVAKSGNNGLPDPGPAYPTIRAGFLFSNQSDPPNTLPQQVFADITCLGVIQLGGLSAYLGPAGAATPNFNHQVWMRIFNMMVKHFAAQDNNTVLIGSNKLFSTMNSGAQLLNSGLQARRGFFSSVRPANNFLQVQANTVASAFFPPGKLIDFLQGYFGNDFNPSAANIGIRSEIESTIRGLKVRYMYTPPYPAAPVPTPLLVNPTQGPILGHVKTCNSLSQIGESARTVTFTYQGTATTVENHYNTHVLSNYTIQFPQLPLVNVGPKSTPNNQNAEVWIPMELLWIEPDQSLRTTVPDNDMQLMAGYARRPPLHNVALLQSAGLNILQRLRLANSGVMQIAPQLLRTDGRVLPIPPLQYGNNKAANSQRMRNGKWDLIGQQFHTGSDLSQLLVIIVRGADFVQVDRGLSPAQQVQQQAQQQQTILDGVAAGLNSYGVTCSPSAQVQHIQHVNRNQLQAAYADFTQPLKASDKIRTILVLLPKEDQNNYAEIKTWGELHGGVNTVCVTRRNAAKSLHQAAFQGNLALKFNAKRGGKNHILGGEFQDLLHWVDGPGTMVVGADVTHPGPASIEHCPSIAAVVASERKDCVRFPGSMRLQAGRTETIIDMKDMMVERLRHWKSKNEDKLPDSILYYRDGVSESQFAMVKQQELNAIKAAYTTVGGQDAKVAITVVVCTKRHQTRFYPSFDKEPSPAERRYYDNNYNFRTGLVVDQPMVRAPHYFDFYLQGHAALQGTARPCHYFVIENGMEFGPDDLQQITYGLSWNYATSLTPISLAAPAYYADKMCERGRAWLRPLLVRGHPLRPTPQQLAAIVNPLGPQATDQQKKARVAQVFASGQNPGQVIFWPNQGGPQNPCRPEVEDSMFYV